MPFFTDAQLRELSAEFPRWTTTRNLGRGTAFPVTGDLPGGLRSDDRFYRTDLSWACYYDGTRWLTAHEYETALPVATTTASPVSATYSANRTDYAPYVTRAIMATNVATTNNATNYWTVNIRGINGAFSAGTTVIGRNTSSDTVAVWSFVETPGGSLSTQTPANYAYWEIQCTKTLAPGAITVTIQLVYRLIVT
jgi:hypothetical protein